jgi:hypothetical protein
MLYQRPKFSCPASSGASTSEKNWDRAFLSESEYAKKYNETPSGQQLGPTELSSI